MLVHLILDLETLSTKTNAVIASLGAISVYGDEVRDSFSINININEQIEKGLIVDQGSLSWWMNRSEKARQSIFKGSIRPELALSKFNSFCGVQVMDANDGAPTDGLFKYTRMWGNGAHFDVSKLANLHEAFDKFKPWEPKADRCYRTIKNIFPDVKGDNLKDEASHVAVEDAHWQAKHLLQIQQQKKFKLQ